MTTQHPEALRLAAELDDGYPLTGDAISAAAELRTQHARITELESQLAQRYDAADVATDSVQEARASHGQAPAEVSPTAGMNIPQRILHVGGRNNDAGYVEFGSIQAVEALVRQVLRDLPAPAQPTPAQADSVQEDAARLDWLLTDGSSMAINSFGGQYRVVDVSCNLVVTDWMPTQRAAIDAAMNKGGSA